MSRRGKETLEDALEREAAEHRAYAAAFDAWQTDVMCLSSCGTPDDEGAWTWLYQMAPEPERAVAILTAAAFLKTFPDAMAN